MTTMKNALTALGVASLLALTSLGAAPALADEVDPGGAAATQQQAEAATAPPAYSPAPIEAPAGDAAPESGRAAAAAPDPAPSPDPQPEPDAKAAPDPASKPAPDAPRDGPSASPSSSPSATPSGSPSEPPREGRPPTAPRGLSGAYSVDEAGQAHVTVTWKAPADLGVTGSNGDPEGGQGRSSFLFQVSLTSGPGSPQTVTLEADEAWNDSPEEPLSWTRVFDVPATAGASWTVAVDASNDGGQTTGPAATTTVSSAPAPRAPSAPTAVVGVYGLDEDGDAHVGVTWRAPADLGVTAASDDPEGGQGRSSFLFRVTLVSGPGAPQTMTFDADEVWGDSPSGPLSWSRGFDVPVSPGETWSVAVEASNDSGQSWGPAASTTVVSPLVGESEVDVAITSATASGHHSPTVSVSWSASGTERVGSWIVVVANVDATTLGEVVVAATRVPAAARTVTLHGGESLTELGLTVGGKPLPNDARLVVVVVAEGPDLEALGASAPVLVTTPSSTPPPPAAPSGSSTGGVTATVSGSTITARVPSAKPGEWVYGYAFSSPIGLGWAQVTNAGTASWSLAGAGLANGAHQLAVLADDGSVLGSSAFSVGVAPAAANDAATRAQLASTGADPTAPLGAAALLVLGGCALVALRRARSARKQT
ncbi:hypothetical protein GCM10027515_33410 [Schumannella luteola]|uniref:LPXTG cell wall anchor domain-containing protein n=1 Tax=Schumannella luteola TaxID=472059 RepID=A0A852YHD7_9MICO|nr:hypothetical protein [Schumannella luteola]NYH00701.1 hypothetical protein [Schumannella luteola]TPX01560.1 hypothetical protein FJ656_26980 [Schumannella luteola]